MQTKYDNMYEYMKTLKGQEKIKALRIEIASILNRMNTPVDFITKVYDCSFTLAETDMVYDILKAFTVDGRYAYARICTDGLENTIAFGDRANPQMWNKYCYSSLTDNTYPVILMFFMEYIDRDTRFYKAIASMDDYKVVDSNGYDSTVSFTVRTPLLQTK